MLPTVSSFPVSMWESTRHREGTTRFGSTSLRRVPTLSDVESSAELVTPGCSRSSSSSVLRPTRPGTPSWESRRHERVVEALALHYVPQGCRHPLLRDLPLLRLHRRHPRDVDEGAAVCPRQRPSHGSRLQSSGHNARLDHDSLVP